MLFSLGPRLALCAQLVRPGRALIDVGTDHAYLPIWLLLSGKSPRAVACDVNPGPLESAARHANQYGVADRLALVRSDGLKKLGPEDGDEIVIAGMGGELILEIVSQASWLRDPAKRLVLQPMSNPGRLRLGLSALGFQVLEEFPAQDSGKIYSAFSVVYAGQPHPAGELYPYMGRLTPGGKDVEKYGEKVILGLKKQALGAGHRGDKEKQETLENVIQEIQRQYLLGDKA